LKDVGGKSVQGISLIRSENGNWNRLLKREETNGWRDLTFCRGLGASMHKYVERGEWDAREQEYACLRNSREQK
jgi:hypothetical protein